VTISLGFKPVPIEVRLARDSDFVTALVADSDWPDGTVIELVFPHDGSTTTWPATVAADTARWDVPRAQVAALLAANARKARLHYRDTPGGPELLWGVGSVVSS
jgi:hypothetical protein